MTGTNTWWLGHLQRNSDVDNVLSQMALVGSSIERLDRSRPLMFISLN